MVQNLGIVLGVVSEFGGSFKIRMISEFEGIASSEIKSWRSDVVTCNVNLLTQLLLFCAAIKWQNY